MLTLAIPRRLMNTASADDISVRAVHDDVATLAGRHRAYLGHMLPFYAMPNIPESRPETWLGLSREQAP